MRDVAAPIDGVVELGSRFGRNLFDLFHASEGRLEIPLHARRCPRLGPTKTTDRAAKAFPEPDAGSDNPVMHRTATIPASLLVAATALIGGCGGGGSSPLPVTTVSVSVDAGIVTGTLAPLWGDHYDLSYAHLGYAAEAGFLPLVQAL